ncbi:MAG: hypothetical protein IT290_12420 [Deltaproteobacteria bacterium]|nr:hypothetical protein [Deltaproteobacteria bacterium]
MEEKQQVVEEKTITTTIGDLICAIADAAREAHIEDSELSRLTHHILLKMLRERTGEGE